VKHLRLSVLAFSVLTLAISNLLFSLAQPLPLPAGSIPPANSAPPAAAAVLGRSTSLPNLYISNNKDNFNTGGVLSQSTLDEPAIQLTSLDSKGDTANIEIFSAQITDILNFIIYNSENKQTNQSVDTSGLTKINSLSTTLSSDENRILLPIENEGIWLLKISMGTSVNYAFLIRTPIAGVIKEGNNEAVIWVQDLVSKRSVPETAVELFSVKDKVESVAKTKTDSSGLVKVGYKSKKFDIGVLTSAGHTALLPINLQYLNSYSGYQSFTQKQRYSRFFVFTDRPLYRPEDTVYFKAVVRDDDDVRYSIPKDNVLVKAYKGWDSKSAFYTQSLPVSDAGTVNGQFVLPANQGTGDFTLGIEIPNSAESEDGYNTWGQGTAYFQVENYRKPDYSLDIITGNGTSETVAGNKIQFIISGAYFSGQPLANQEVKYTVGSSGYYEYEYLGINGESYFGTDYYYGYWGGKTVYNSAATLDGSGQAVISLDTSQNQFRFTTPQVFSVTAEFTDETGNPVETRKNFLVYPAEYSIYRHSNSSGGQVNQPYTLPILIKSHTGSSIKGISLTAKITRESWISQPLAAGQKYPNYVKETQELPPLSAVTDQLGKAVFSFTPAQTGSYRFTVEAKDHRGYTVSKEMSVWVSDQARPAPTGQLYQELKIETDKDNYEPTDKINLKIWSDIPDHDFLLTFERDRVNRYQVIRISGQNTTIPLRLEPTDVPNIFVTVTGFDENYLISDTVNIPVSAEGKRLKVTISPESTRYGPGQTAAINIETRDENGKPVPADVAFWAVDKAIFELSDSNLGSIFDRFWSKRYNNTSTSHSLESLLYVSQAEMGGCFLSDTQVLMADGSLRPIQQVHTGDYILTRNPQADSLVKAKVTGTHATSEDGYLTINTQLRLTPDHLIFVNGSWKTAGSIQPGDLLTDAFGKPVTVDSIEWQAGKIPVYNLEVEKYHTFIADGFWVHNDKGEGARSIFKDTAYWNPSVKTGSDGKARIVFKLPDNLTTWTLASVASTPDTKVGQGTTELLVSKEVFVRPVLPSFVRVGDTARISALVHNFTDAPQDFSVTLDFNSGKITSEKTLSSVVISPNGSQQVFWDISPEEINPEAKFSFTAKSKLGKSDSIIVSVPSLAFGFSDPLTFVGTDNQEFTINIPSDTNLKQSALTVSLAANLLGTVPDAMRYLLHYPYGCVEQTTSSLVPALITKGNLDLYYDAVESNDINKIITKGIQRLISLQSSDGGWGWWSEGSSQIYITDYVLENLLYAKKLGVDIPDYLTQSAVNYLKNVKPQNSAETVYRIYGLSLVDTPDLPKITEFDRLGPVALSLAAIVNSKTDTNPDTNGLKKLVSLAVPTGESLYWPSDPDSSYPSIEASTAFAMKAVLSASGDRDIAVKAARYLQNSRKRNYWANTHATALAINAITALYRTGGESAPDYTYIIKVNNKDVASARVSSPTQLIKPITISPDLLQTGTTNKISVTKTGTGQIYSTLLGNLWRTDKTAAPVSNTISLTKNITNTKGEKYNIGVGDTVNVTLKVTNLPPDSRYLVVEDQLPAGLIPINTNLKNASSDRQYDWYTNREFTQTGVVLSSWASLNTYTYQARAITEGVYQTPPAVAQLMYQPEVFARTAADTYRVDRTSNASLVKQLENQLTDTSGRTLNIRSFIYLFIFLVVIAVIIAVFKRIKNRRPPIQPPITQSSSSAFQPPVDIPPANTPQPLPPTVSDP
jgi:hypothetical protein